MKENESRIPVTIVTGYLGAGKTTFLNHLLKNTDEKVAVIVNEFGDIGIDDQILEKTEEEIIEINSGCICCNVRKDLIDTLSMLAISRKEKMIEFDRVVIETTGLADPAPVVQTFLMDKEMIEDFVIDSVCALIDAKHISNHLDQKGEALSQIAFADMILLNKTDLVSNDHLTWLIKRLEKINPKAVTYLCENSQIELEKVLGIYSFNLQEKVEVTPDLLINDHHSHDDEISSLSLQEHRALDLRKLNLWVSFLVQMQGERLYRYKGVLNIEGIEKRFVFQGVHMLFAGDELGPWGSDPRMSELVFIGKNLNKQKLEEQFRRCV
ncbi:zinc transporter [Halobacillus andaensis]|uniref:Zinc transporter n=1 Tax=Halobacillus andaensis TaxID=1176239 RepID=A0A917B6L4_HALAA|nr:GTP-binding protein [Halobacillus andaensis]MBP2006484.1 G3E family GTPase [Halobacillus andaensis]GGF27704.1 zinc transporter [Halobacillus andaensis]